MATSQGVYTTNSSAGKELRESLLDIMTDLTPKRTPLFSGLGDSEATQSLHSWLNDEQSRATTSGAATEGAEASFSLDTAPGRPYNLVQEIPVAWKVSDRQKNANVAGPDSVKRAKARALQKMKFHAEYSLIFGSGISGNSGTAWEMKGLRSVLTTNVASYGSGTTITENILNDVLQKIYDAVDDAPIEAYMPIGVKRKVSGFTAGSTKNVDAEDKRLVNAVDVYESDVASMVKLFAHRDLSAKAVGGDNFMFALQPEYFKKAWQMKPYHKDLPANGSYEAGQYNGALTLEYRQEKAGVKVDGLI